MIKLQLRYSGLAPIMARSFTVPAMASLPISPPAKKSGETVKLSVVKAMGPVTGSRAASSPRSRISLPKWWKNSWLISWFISTPPPPWLN
ncbi:hypothetical protein D3C79_903600 [compost metagenome]